MAGEGSRATLHRVCPALCRFLSSCAWFGIVSPVGPTIARTPHAYTKLAPLQQQTKSHTSEFLGSLACPARPLKVGAAEFPRIPTRCPRGPMILTRLSRHTCGRPAENWKIGSAKKKFAKIHSATALPPDFDQRTTCCQEVLAFLSVPAAWQNVGLAVWMLHDMS